MKENNPTDDLLIDYLERSARERRARLKISPPDAKIWRYMDFPKFMCTLEDRALFFARADSFEDPFEGSYPRANVEARLSEGSGGSIKFIVFDPTKKKNNIIGRCRVSHPVQLQNYPYRLDVGKEITEDEFETQPEIYMDVDVLAQRLGPVYREAAERRGGGA